MLNFDDPRWSSLEGGYRTKYDPRPALRRLAATDDSAIEELREELYHQDDVGTASYAAVPALVQIHRDRQLQTWETYALIASIELQRGRGKNPALPDWLAEDYFKAIESLAQAGLTELPNSTSVELSRAILALLGLWKELRTAARILIEFTDDELKELEAAAFGESA
jgi:hypothetical protein